MTPAAAQAPGRERELREHLQALLNIIKENGLRRGYERGSAVDDAIVRAKVELMLTPGPQPSAPPAEPVAWVHEDDLSRVISAIQKAGAVKDGGASASSVRPYSVPAYTQHAPLAAPAAAEPEIPSVIREAVEAAFEQREGWMQKIAAAVRAIGASEPRAEGLTDAARDVLAERQRQVSVEGWTPEHDDEQTHASMAQAAACYALHAAGYSSHTVLADWPWDPRWWKPSDDPRRDLEKAGALILAEIERLDRAAQKRGEG